MDYKLRDYQIKGRDFLKVRQYAMLADDMGIGKTAQAVCATEKDWKILIICPASVKYQWQKEFMIWTQRSSEVLNGLNAKPPQSDILIINYDLLGRKNSKVFKRLKEMRFDCVICDEAHRLKNAGARRTRAVLSKYGLHPKTKRMWFLTGTPLKNRPIELHPILSKCAEDLIKPYHSYLEYAYRYCGAYEGNFGLVATGASHLEELRSALVPFWLRREAEEVLTELPEVMSNIVEIECTPTIKRLIDEEKEATLDMVQSAQANAEDEVDPSWFKLGETARIRQVLAKHKVEVCKTYIKDMLEDCERLVIFFHHHSVKDEIIKMLGKNTPVVLSGKDSSKQKRDKIARFTKPGGPQVFLGQIQACGEGVDGLQHVCSTCLFIEPAWSPGDIKQCIGRLRRMGQKDFVRAYLLVIKDTIEAQMIKSNIYKQRVIDTLVKPRKEENMYLEDKVNQLVEAVQALTNVVESFVKPQGGQLSGPVTQPEPEVKPKAKKKAAPKAAKTKETEPEENTEDLLETARALVLQIVKLYPKDGKAQCKAVVEQCGKSGDKLVDLNAEQLAQAIEAFESMVNEDDI